MKNYTVMQHSAPTASRHRGDKENKQPALQPCFHNTKTTRKNKKCTLLWPTRPVQN
uniref:Uncharacterized protein n=1 Tax=Rhizophora mucronata TaxID=61149 RepID=A0A2P2IU34_RHIMU